MNKTKITAAVLLSALLFSSCTVVNEAEEIEPKAQENITEAAEERTELWIEIGSRTYADGADYGFDAAAYFAEKTPVNTVLTLSDDMYFYDAEAFEAVASMVYRYIRDTYGEDALTDLDSRTAYKDEWLKTVDPSLSYSQDSAIEKTLSQISASSSDDYGIIAELDGVTYDFYGYDSSITPYLAHLIMYYANEGLTLLRDELVRIDPDGIMFNASANLEFVMDFSGTTVMRPDGSYSISRYEDILAAAVMMMSESDDPKAHWITEGLAEIYGKSRGYYFHTVYDRVFYLHPSTEETLRAYADAGEAVGLYHISVMKNFYGAGGKIEEENIPEIFSDIYGYRYSLDSELYTHSAALADIEVGYQARLDSLYTVRSDGGELSRIQAGSFVLWLMENYDIGDILAVCRDYSKLTDVFGKDYDTLKADWLAWLDAKFE